MLPGGRFVPPRLGNGLSNRNIELCRCHNVIFSVDFRQVLAIRRMGRPGILPGCPALAFYSQIPQAPSSTPEAGGEGEGRIPVSFFSEAVEPARAAALSAEEPLTVVCFVACVLYPIFVTVSQSLSPIVGGGVFLCLTCFSRKGPLNHRRRGLWLGGGRNF